MLKNLVQIKSISGGEADIQKYIFEYLSALHLKPIYIGGNVVAKIVGNNSENALIFNAHVDTVSPGDLSKWKYDPYAVTISKGKIYGLGTSDEKASVEILLKLARFYSSHSPSCDLWLTFVVNEEVDGSGSREFVKWFVNKCEYKNVSAILGEPTGLDSIDIAHKGNIFIKVTAYGDSGHGSEPQKIKKHAVFEIYKAAEKLKSLAAKWSLKYQNEILGSPTIGLITSIHAGNVSSPNKFSDSCYATFDIRTVPEMHDFALNEIKKILKGCKVENIYDPVSFGYTNPDSQIVNIFKKFAKVKLGVFQGSTDMCFFTDVGIPAVIFGPGEKRCMHISDEFCKLDKIEKCFRIYKKVVDDFGGF